MTSLASEAKEDGGKQVILVTGGSGMVGRACEAIVEAERAEGTLTGDQEWVFLSSKDGDLRNFEETKAIFERHKPTHCLHLAAFVGGLFRNLKYKVEFYRHNTLMNDNVLECCRIYEVAKLVSCLSTCIFPDKTTYPIDETMLHTGPPHSSNAGYAYAKRMIDVLNRCYNEEYGCQFTSVIPTNIYGPHDNFNLEDSHVIPGLIHKACIAKDAGADFVVWGSGTPLRQFIYSNDLAKLMIWTLRSYDSIEPIILSVDESAEISIRDVALLIADAVGIAPEKVVFDSDKPDGQFKKTADNTKLRKLHPDYKFVEIGEGIKKTVEWFIANRAEART